MDDEDDTKSHAMPSLYALVRKALWDRRVWLLFDGGRSAPASHLALAAAAAADADASRSLAYASLGRARIPGRI